MDKLPKDPAILVSAVNMYLRDEEFNTLDSLCFCYNTTADKLKNYLLKNGYKFDEEQKQFKGITK